VLEAFDAAWQGLVVVELDERIAASAVDIARDHTVRAADAIHLASALAVAPEGIAITFACFDRRLWDAASGFALKRLPTEL
jgi:predicted nucleic acid-binding protein